MKKELKWALFITVLAFIITVFFSSISQFLLNDITTIVGIIIIIMFIVIGVLFDIIGVAVQSSNEEPFHAMASKKIKGAVRAKKMIKNAARVSSFCNDVIGDICNIITGSSTMIVAGNLALKYDWNFGIVTLVFTGIVASLTIGGKALGKEIAVKNSEKIIHTVSKIIK